MQKRVNQLIVLSSLILLLGLSFASAGFFGDVWNSITGNVVKENNLVAYYDFNEDVVDEQVNGDLCTLYNIDASNFIGGFKNGAMKLNGINEYLTCPGYNLKDFTISMWVKLEEKSAHALVERGTSGRYGLWNLGSTNQFGLVSGADANGWVLSEPENIEDGEWHYLTGVYASGVGAKLYVDGQQISASSGTVRDPVTSGNLVIGQSSRYGGSFTKGLIDELKIWNTALTAGDVTEEYNSYFAEPEPNCTDSDGGKDYYVKGTVSSDATATDKCGVYVDDVWNPNLLTEWYCDSSVEPNGFWHDEYNCPNGCQDGACLTEPAPNQTTCTDSDGGLKPSIIGYTDFKSGSFEFKNKDSCALVYLYNGEPSGSSKTEYCSGENSSGGNCYVQEAFCKTDENGNFIDAYADKLIKCPYGCQDGACLTEPAPNQTTCEDSDGGLNYYENGTLYGSGGAVIFSESGQGDDTIVISSTKARLLFQDIWIDVELGKYYDSIVGRFIVKKIDVENGQVFLDYFSLNDFCTGQTLTERVCSMNIEKFDYTNYNCPSGCQDGACLPETASCSSIFENPILLQNIGRYTLSSLVRTRNFSGNEFGSSGVYKELGYYSENGNKRIEIIILKLDDENINLQNSEWLQEVKSDSFWTKESHWFNEENQEVYTIFSNNGRGKANFWFKDNYLIFINEETRTSEGDNTDKILEFVEKLKDNDFEYFSDDYDAPWELDEITRKYLESCESNIQEPCRPVWQKKVEPVVCPPHGTQNEIIRDIYECGDKKERELTCSPGMCAGCYKPRWAWLDWKSEDNICVPYGTRFMEQKEDEDKVYEGMEGNDEEGYELQIIDANNIKFRIWNKEQFIDETYNLQAGESFSIGLGGEDFKLLLKDIIYSSQAGTENYVILSVFQDFPVYCNYDGQINRQTSDWRQCQNSYECESNLCSGGECTGINEMIKSVAGYKSFVVKIMCKLGDFFGLRDYEECVVNRLGEEYLETQEETNETSENISCTDSDGGVEYYKKGEVNQIINGELFNKSDRCGYSFDDNPSDNPNLLNEWACRSDSQSVEYTYDCPHGCENGACISTDVNPVELIVSESNEQYDLKFIDGYGDSVIFPLVYVIGYPVVESPGLVGGDKPGETLVLDTNNNVLTKRDYFILNTGDPRSDSLAYSFVAQYGGSDKITNVDPRVEIEIGNNDLRSLGLNSDGTFSMRLGGKMFNFINASPMSRTDFNISLLNKKEYIEDCGSTCDYIRADKDSSYYLKINAVSSKEWELELKGPSEESFIFKIESPTESFEDEIEGRFIQVDNKDPQWDWDDDNNDIGEYIFDSGVRLRMEDPSSAPPSWVFGYK